MPVKGPIQPRVLFLFTRGSLAIFYSEHVGTKEITVKLLKIVKLTFRSMATVKNPLFRGHRSDGAD